MFKTDFRPVLNQMASRIEKRTGFLWPSFVRYGPQYNPLPLKIPSGQNHQVPSNPPLISVVIPSFNQGSFLEKAISSLLDQNYPRLELIIIDGGSTDNSLKILNKYSSNFTWWCSGPDRGQAHALNKGFKHATGDIMAWLNADDRHLPDTLAAISAFMAGRPDVDVVYGHRILIDEDDKEIGRWILPAHNDTVLTWADFIPQETLFWRRTLWRKVGGRLNESFQFAIDWDLLLRFREAGAKMVRLPYFLGLFRIHPNQKTSALIEQRGFQEMQILRRRCLGYFPQSYRIAMGVAGYLLRARLAEIIRPVRLAANC